MKSPSFDREIIIQHIFAEAASLRYFIDARAAKPENERTPLFHISGFSHACKPGRYYDVPRSTSLLPPCRLPPVQCSYDFLEHGECNTLDHDPQIFDKCAVDGAKSSSTATTTLRKSHCR